MAMTGTTSRAKDFSAMFCRATENPAPLPYQSRLALGDALPSLLDVPTGLGKTAAAVLAWVWRRRFADESIRAQTPRRLVYCLPMRVLVEQTYGEAVKWLDRLGLLAGLANWTEPGADNLPTKRSQLKRRTNGGGRGYGPDPDATGSDGWASQHGDQRKYRIAVHLLLGGEEKTDWALWPERDAVLIGTQDMLISRALNRGYAAGRARWPLEFGLLNTDCLWVFDEIQIMDASLATSLQLDAWRRSLQLRPSRDAFPTNNEKHLPKPCRSLWMSATMAKHWLERAVDWLPRVEAEWTSRHQLSETERTDDQLRSGQLFQVEKQLCKAPINPLEKPKTKDNRADKVDAERKQTEYLKRLAEHISKPENHAASGLTLLIVNTVDRATKLFNLLRRQSRLEGVPIKLIHSRFRPYEREKWSDFLSQRDDSRRILISTQVVEAGVDLSAAVLYTELAPWASLVQRFGRCARYPGESGQVIWLDLDLGSDRQPVDHWARPYDRAELIAARERLNNLGGGGVGLQELTVIKTEIESEQTGEQAVKLFPYEPRFVPRDKDLFDLFDTMPDLTGADVDVSRYIRDGEELDVQVFWREIVADQEPTKKDRPHRRELCPVPFHRFRDFARELLKQRHRIWRRRYSKGPKRTSSWELLDFGSVDRVVYPGQVFLLEKSCGGYSAELGWTGDPQHTNFELPPAIEAGKATGQDEEDDADDLSQIDQWLSVLDHTLHVCEKLEQILDRDGLTESDTKVLRLAARWHDRGKAHPAFTAKIKPEFLVAADAQQKLGGQPPAKAPDGKDRNTGQVDESKNAWRRDKLRPEAANTPAEQQDKRRPGHRHELASALAILETLYRGCPDHPAFAWESELAQEFSRQLPECDGAFADDPLVKELADLSPDELDLLVYLVAAHHGKVRMLLRSAPDDERDGVPDPCPPDKRQARGVRDGDSLPQCQIPLANLNADGLAAPEVILSLDPMELGLSSRYGASWRERMQLLLERLGPFWLGYLEALLRAADCRASAEEDEGGKEGN
jgi:CRISPR-associated endonuclease/helicase Cas3